MSSDVCAVVVTFNGMRWIRKCLCSLQTTPVDIIVVDNCSADNSAEFIKSNFPNVHVIALSQNIGFGKANNIGIEEALSRKAKYIFLLNQDARLETGTIERLVALLQKCPEVGVLSPVHLNGDGSLLDKQFLNYLGADNSEGRLLLTDCTLNRRGKELYEVPFVNAAAWLVPRETFELVGGFNPLFFQYGEDHNFLQRVLYHGKKISVCKDAFIYHDREGRGFDVSKSYGVADLIYTCCDVSINDFGSMLRKTLMNLIRRSIKDMMLGRIYLLWVDLKKISFLLSNQRKMRAIVDLTRTKGPHFLDKKSAIYESLRS
jgi:GT2 family glycosyltransferase